MQHLTPGYATDQEPPVIVVRPSAWTAPLVFASPHSGRSYPASFVAEARLQGMSLRRSEDSFVDDLFADVTQLGAPLVRATFPRAFCDPNREPWELDQAMFQDTLPSWVNTRSPRVGAGLGTIARVVGSGERIYNRKLRFAEAEFRVATFWQPYHDALQAEIEATRARFGACLLIDCHSMPSPAGAGPPLPGLTRGVDVVLGDAHGTTCAPSVTLAAEQALAALGFSVRRNDPYAGGYTTRHYGRPSDGVHALQVEIARRLYMDEATIARSASFDPLKARLSQFAESLASEARRLPAFC